MLRRISAPLSLFALASAILSAGETHTLTSKDGRSIEAEIVSYKGETLRIRRTDTNRELQLPVSTLATTDQTAVRKFIRDNPDLRETIKPGDIRIEFSRAKFERETTESAYWRDENAESWGFSISILNQTNAPLEGLRVDYIVYAIDDPDNVQSAARNKTSSDRLQRVTGTEKIAAIPSGQRSTIRTTPVISTRVKYTDDVRMITADGKLVRSWRDKALHGVWLRVYDGDKLVHEASSPENLRTSERWDRR